jgi:hypothetical protein
VVSFTPLPLYPQERAPGTHLIGGWVDPRASLDDMEKRDILQKASLVCHNIHLKKVVKTTQK